MKHVIYRMKGSDPAPAGDGSTESWFRYYKWPADRESFEAFVPRRVPFLEAETGDLLWFVMDDHVLGCVPLLRVDTPSLPSQVQELWYQTGSVEQMLPPFRSEWLQMGFEQLADEVYEKWRAMTRKSS